MTQALAPEQVRFFETFGYIILPGLLKDQIEAITADFEGVFADRGVVHDPTKRTCIVPFADQREGLCALLDDPRIEGLAASLLGDDFNYIGSDGNCYSGDTPWHSDGFHTVGKYVKIAIYLDLVGRDTGALRVIAGSHRVGDDWAAKQAIRSQELWGIPQSEVPAVSLDSRPGDVVAFNHNLMHAAFGGSNRRRMFTLNLCSHAQTAAEVKDLEDFIGGAARFWIDQTHGELMKATAGPGRMRHLQQVIDHEEHLPALAAQCRATMSEPSRG
jgi:ectoine hydroxylase-related dioxygenase (phytanoyl-CoA dioxygenase family)